MTGRPRPGGPVLRLREVAVGYGDTPVVAGVDLELRPGEVVALLGANGSGKTTLIRTILGLLPVVAGTIELFGHSHADHHDRCRIGYVPQRHTAGGPVPATVREVVGSGRLPRRRLLSRQTPADRDAVQRAIDVVGLSGREHSTVAELSGGQQRRVLIARALAGEPDFLVLDEPTAGVDAASQHTLATTLARLATAAVPMIIVTHEPAPIADLVTTFVVLHEGRVSYRGDAAGLAGEHRDLYDQVLHHHHHDEADDDALLSAPLGGT